MGYAEYLRELLRPLCIYDVDRGAGAAELETLGSGLDGICTYLDRIEREALPISSVGPGLDKWSAILPYRPAGATTEELRQTVMALLLIGDNFCSEKAINLTASGCGISATVQESGESQTVYVFFPGVRGEPDNFETLKWRLEQIIPCHLQTVYRLTYLQWQELESIFADWNELEAGAESWDKLETTAP